MISVILAGGAGVRLWPLSRKFSPKFLLKIGNNKYSLFQQTFLRVKEITDVDKIFVVVNEEYKFLIKENIQDLKIDFPKENIIAEPDVKNTLLAATLGCSVAKKRFSEDEIVGVFPSDHIIKPLNKFLLYIKKAKNLAKEGYIVVFGIKPTRVETEYGYIEVGGSLYKRDNDIFEVKRFIEKPDFNLAKKLIHKNKVFWNSGIFVFSLKTFFEELKLYQKDLYDKFKNLDLKNLKEIYEDSKAISIDKGLIEKTKSLVMVATKDIFWDDVGSWVCLDRIYKKDSNGNIILSKGFVGAFNKNLSVVGDKRLIVGCGLKDLIIVDTEDALLVLNKNYTSKIKEIIEKIKNDATKYHKTTYRPWGFYTVLTQKDNYKVKLINVLPKKKISLQKHLKRDEEWFVVSGVAKITYNNRTIYIKSGKTFKVKKGIPHRLENPSNRKILEIVEVSQGRYLGEDDIIRLEED